MYLMKVNRYKRKETPMVLTKTVTKDGKPYKQETFAVTAKPDDHGINLWYGDAWFVRKTRLGIPFEMGGGFVVTWTAEVTPDGKK